MRVTVAVSHRCDMYHFAQADAVVISVSDFALIHTYGRVIKYADLKTCMSTLDILFLPRSCEWSEKCLRCRRI